LKPTTGVSGLAQELGYIVMMEVPLPALTHRNKPAGNLIRQQLNNNLLLNPIVIGYYFIANNFCADL